jgi:AraC-like DNA-binding protein
MFLDNKYTKVYYNIINNAVKRGYIKERFDMNQTHHIIPRCMGGTDDSDNLVVLTYKEHRLCHRLLIKMTLGEYKHKMMYAYLLFNKSYDTSGMPSPQMYCTAESYVKMAKTRKDKGSYKRGKDNIFSSPEIIKQVKKRMTENNPMKRPEQRERMSQNNNNPNVRPIVVEGITFPTIGAASRHFNTTPYLLKKRFTYHFVTEV